MTPLASTVSARRDARLRSLLPCSPSIRYFGYIVLLERTAVLLSTIRRVITYVGWEDQTLGSQHFALYVTKQQFMMHHHVLCVVSGPSGSGPRVYYFSGHCHILSGYFVHLLSWLLLSILHICLWISVSFVLPICHFLTLVTSPFKDDCFPALIIGSFERSSHCIHRGSMIHCL